MKVLGKSSGDTYIVQVSHTELEKVFEKYYGKLNKLDAGVEMNLAEGYDFRDDIKRACNEMRDAMKTFDSKLMTMLRFAEMVGALPDEEKGGAA